MAVRLSPLGLHPPAARASEILNENDVQTGIFERKRI
jgi:hypothetical protein